MKSKNPNQSEINRMTWAKPEVRQRRIDGILKTRWGDNIDRKKYYNDVIKSLIWDGYTATKMGKENLVDCSSPIVKKLTKLYGDVNDLNKLKENGVYGKGEKGRSLKGQPSHLKGKTYEEIFKSKKLANKRRKITSDWMKTDRNIRKYMSKVSKGQKLLYEQVLKKHPAVVMEFPIKNKLNNKIYYLDIADVQNKLDFEFDGGYWHNTPEAIDRDRERDAFLYSIGWKVFRFTFDIRKIEDVDNFLNKINILLWQE